MNYHYRTQVLVFKKEDVLEADRIFSVFSNDFGRIEVLGKSIRKINSKLRGNMDIFNLSEIEFVHGKNKKTLIDSLLVKKFKNIQAIPEKMKMAYGISEILNSFIKGQEKDLRIWDIAVDSFEKLNNSGHSAKECSLVYYYFIWNFIFVLGYGPEVFKCAACFGKLNPFALYFSNKEGGIICGNCFSLKKDGLKVESNVVKILRLILNKDWDLLKKLKAEAGYWNLLKEVSDNYYNYLTQRNLLK